ncbi:hypothetical protein HGM15179_011596 [Zosterops borbonicus]|uniref:Uncharacterized protein n=1 Tax=Zosterops borbonicus TaxID=364589 RepID=A0A8K1LJ20_9PASS|nr:hypothetical protein HGM15179_011596 [Zosterops borbonicus]
MVSAVTLKTKVFIKHSSNIRLDKCYVQVEVRDLIHLLYYWDKLIEAFQHSSIVGEDETGKPYKYVYKVLAKDSENMKPISEVEMKASFEM